MARLIDTSVFVALDRRGASLDAFVTLMGEEPFAIASITASELLVGVYRTVEVNQRLRRLSFVEAVLHRVPALPFDTDSARTHARLVADLMATGLLIGGNDLVIAATALTYGYSLLTHNLRHFERVPDLVVHQPVW
jgi:tRNA(fMet)-specific endonuclease VapC